jgi:ketosteroid isomerase-like protein
MNNVETVQRLYQAFAEGDVTTVVAGMDPGIEWREAEGNPYQPSGAAWVGPNAIVENLFMKLGSEWDSFAVHPSQYHDAEATVVVEGRYSGKYLATGADVDAQYCHVFKLKDGKVTSFQQFTDTGQFQAVMGVS